MRILIISAISDRRGHYGQNISNLCQELAKLGNEVVYFTNKIDIEKYIKEPILFKLIEYKGGKYSFSKYENSKINETYAYLRNSLIITIAGLKYAMVNKFDVIEMQDIEYGLLSLMLHLFYHKKTPVVIMIYAPNFGFKYYTGSIYIRIYKEIQKIILRSVLGSKIKAIITIGEFNKAGIEKQLLNNKKAIIENIREGNTFPDKIIDKLEARKIIGIKYKGPILLFFGMLRQEKGIDILLEAVRKLKGKEFKILIAGSAYDYTQKFLEESINEKLINENIILNISYIPDEKVGYYFMSANAIILPYTKIYAGGSGPLVIQACVYRLPAIVSDVAEMGNIVKNSKMGIVVPSEDSTELANAINKYLNLSDEEINQMRANSFSIAKSWKQMAVDYDKLYRKINEYN